MTDFETREIETANHQETFRAGSRLASLLKAGDIVALYGELGSGKTVFTQGLCSGLEVKPAVTSPTFTLVHEYSGLLPVFHFDFYRLESAGEVEMLDLESYFSAGGISVIEWAERGEKLLPEPVFKIYLAWDELKENPDFRRLKFIAPLGRNLDRLNL
jgi:tRNA threonylcarbamoyladenosine biosynthesis protein TsaE